MRVRFDDSLRTVLAADTSTAFGVRAAFRQLVDLVGRGRAPADADILARLAALRGGVPVETRAAIARGLALSDPPVALVNFLADDVAEVCVAVLRGVRLPPEDWTWLLPRLGPLGRSVLRRRGDLPPSAMRALDSFGSTDFALGHDPAEPAARPADAPAAPIYVATPDADPRPVGAQTTPMAAEAAPERFEIAELVGRLADYQRRRAATTLAGVTAVAHVQAFRFETDAAGVVRWIDSAPRGAAIGLSLDHGSGEAPCVDGVAAGAFRKRASFANARMVVAGTSPLGGAWRISAVPTFDQARGHFIGYRGAARRPRVEEDAARLRPRQGAAAVEGLRRLVHELRTPTTAIAGFSELIEEQVLGPVTPFYRERAGAIRQQVADLVGAIDDLDVAARLESDALELRVEAVALAPLVARVAADLAPLAARRAASLAIAVDGDRCWAADANAAERLVSRLLGDMLAVADEGEPLSVSGTVMPGGLFALAITRPRALRGRTEADLLAVDDGAVEGEDAPSGASLLGLGFALRLARHLAAELGGRLTIEEDRLTLALPAASTAQMGQASTVAP